MAHPYWPFFDLEIRTANLVLRYPDDDMLMRLVDLAAQGIHPPEAMPFAIPWSRAASPSLERNALQFHWRNRADVSPAAFRISFAVSLGEELVGSCDLMADEFATLRQVETGSWLGQRFQGRGIGKEMRLACLSLGFDGLGADWATTSAWADNPASLAVTHSLGYRHQGTRRAVREGQRMDLIGYEMDREMFDAIRPEGTTLHGVDAVREFLDIS